MGGETSKIEEDFPFTFSSLAEPVSCEMTHFHGVIMRLSMLRPTTPCTGYSGASGDLTNLNINCPNIRDIPYNQSPCRRWGITGDLTHAV